MLPLSTKHIRVNCGAIAVLATALLLPPSLQAQAATSPSARGPTSNREAQEGPSGVAATAPTSGAYSTSGGRTNSMGDPKGNQAGLPSTGPRSDAYSPDAGVKIKFSNADAKLMRELAGAQLAEIKMSGLATAVSRNPAIRSYAEKMLEQHLTALDELRRLAEQGGVILPGGVDTEHAAILHDLARVVGDEFDQMYLSQAGLAAHEKSHRLFQEAGKRAQSPELRAYVANRVPIIEQHLQLAQQMKENPAQALALVRATVMAGQSTSIGASSGASSEQSRNNSGNRGSSSIAGSAVRGAERGK